MTPTLTVIHLTWKSKAVWPSRQLESHHVTIRYHIAEDHDLIKHRTTIQSIIHYYTIHHKENHTFLTDS